MDQRQEPIVTSVVVDEEPVAKRHKTEEEQEHARSTTPTVTASTRGSESGEDEAADEEEAKENSGSSNEDETSEQDESDRARSPARGVAVQLDSDDLDLESTSMDAEEEAMLRRILSAAAARGIPLELLAHMPHLAFEAEDDEPVEYPFDSPPQSLQDVAQFILSDKCQKVLILAGAGMSVASGIPDFRSSNGLYATLQADRLTATWEQRERIRTDPSYSLDQRLFLENPLPCLEVNREFVLGIHEKKWKATLAHRFVELLYEKLPSKFCRLYTQNIDGLEDQCGLPHDRRIAVHGSMDEAACAVCGSSMDLERFCQLMKAQIKDITGQDTQAPTESTPILCPCCRAPSVKPNIVLFRSSLPKVFFRKVPVDTQDVDLLLIMGTSLGVAPANSLVWRVPKSSMRVLINREPVGWHLGLDYEDNDRDFFGGGNCEDVCLDLMTHLGWLEDLRPLIDELPESSKVLLRRALDTKDGNATEKEAPTQQPGVEEEDAKPAAVETSISPGEPASLSLTSPNLKGEAI